MQPCNHRPGHVKHSPSQLPPFLSLYPSLLLQHQPVYSVPTAPSTISLLLLPSSIQWPLATSTWLPLSLPTAPLHPHDLHPFQLPSGSRSYLIHTLTLLNFFNGQIAPLLAPRSSPYPPAEPSSGIPHRHVPRNSDQWVCSPSLPGHQFDQSFLTTVPSLTTTSPPSWAWLCGSAAQIFIHTISSYLPKPQAICTSLTRAPSGGPWTLFTARPIPDLQPLQNSLTPSYFTSPGPCQTYLQLQAHDGLSFTEACAIWYANILT